MQQIRRCTRHRSAFPCASWRAKSAHLAFAASAPSNNALPVRKRLALVNKFDGLACSTHTPSRAYAVGGFTRPCLSLRDVLFGTNGKKSSFRETDGRVGKGEEALEAVLEREAEEEETQFTEEAEAAGVDGAGGDEGPPSAIAAAATPGAPDTIGMGKACTDTDSINDLVHSASAYPVANVEGSTDPERAAAKSLAEPTTGAPPPQRRVRRYYIPGLEGIEAGSEDAFYYEDSDGFFRQIDAKTARKKDAEAAAGAAANGEAAPAIPPAMAAAVGTDAADGAKGSTKLSEACVAVANGVAPSKTTTLPLPQHAPPLLKKEATRSSGDSSDRTGSKPVERGQPKSQPEAVKTTIANAPQPAAPLSTPSAGLAAAAPAATAVKSGKRKDLKPTAAELAEVADSTDKTDDVKRAQQAPSEPRTVPDSHDSIDLHALLPNALMRGLSERNKRVKKILMAALGSEFAKAGMCNDGVRTSFSVVSYQTVKQRTGLKSIPSKLLVSCLTSPDKTIDWIDISAHPTATLSEYKEAIQEVLIGLGMHATMVDDSTEPMLLPQVTLTKECQSFLMRFAIDVQGSKRMDSFQDLTNRFTLFITNNRVITVHRTQCTYVEDLKRNWQTMLEEQEGRVTRYLLYYFVKETVQTFTRAISRCIIEFDRYEAGLFTATRARASLAREIYHIKRRAAVYGRTLTLTKDAYTHMSASMNVYPSNLNYQEVMHDLAHMESLAEELNANADSVLQLLFQLSSYQVNELMRVLTLFSAFFIPLGFIAGVYGMNFENLPFLHSEHGEVYCGLLMIFVAGFIYSWFKAKHFI